MGAMDDLLAEYEDTEPEKPTKGKTPKLNLPTADELFGPAPAAQVEAPAPAMAPVPKPMTDYRTDTATNPEQARQIAAQKAKEANDSTAFGYGVARGATLGAVDRLVGLGTDIGEHLGASDAVPAHPGAYQEGRKEYLEGEDKSRAISPGMHLAGEVVGGAATAPIVPQGTLGRLAVSGGLGAAAGALNTREDDAGKMAANAAKGAALGVGVEGTAGTAARKLIRNAPQREMNRTVAGVVENEYGRVNSKPANALANDIKDVQDVLKSSPDARKAIQQGPDVARPVIKQKMAEATAGQSDRYALIDETIPKETATKLLNKLVKAEGEVSTRDIALVKPILEKMRDNIRKILAPRWSGQATWKGGKTEISTEELRAWVTSAQDAGKLALVGISPSDAAKAQGIAAKIANDILESRLDAAAAKGGQHVKDAVDRIRESDRLFSAWKNIDEAQEALQRKVMAQNAGLDTRLANAGAATEATGALAATAAGRPDIALAIVGKRPVMKGASEAAKFVNDRMLVPLQEAAQRGAPLAFLLRMAAENGAPQGLARAVFEKYQKREPIAVPQIPQTIQEAQPARSMPIPIAPAWPKDYATSTRTQ